MRTQTFVLRSRRTNRQPSFRPRIAVRAGPLPEPKPPPAQRLQPVKSLSPVTLRLDRRVHGASQGPRCGWAPISKRPNFYSSAYFLETLFGCERGVIVEGVFGREINMLICDGVFNLVVAQNDVPFFVLTGAAYRAAGTVVPSPDRFRRN